MVIGMVMSMLQANAMFILCLVFRAASHQRRLIAMDLR